MSQRHDALTKERKQRQPASIYELAALLNDLIAAGKGGYHVTCNDEYQIYKRADELSFSVDDAAGILDIHGRP